MPVNEETRIAENSQPLLFWEAYLCWQRIQLEIQLTTNVAGLTKVTNAGICSNQRISADCCDHEHSNGAAKYLRY